VAVHSKHDKYLCLIKCAEFVDYPTNYLLLKKESTPCICVRKNQLHAFVTLINQDSRSTKQKIYSTQLSNQLGTYHMIFSLFFLLILKKSCSCVHTNTQHSPCFPPYHKIFPQVSVLQFRNSYCQELQNLQ